MIHLIQRFTFLLVFSLFTPSLVAQNTLNQMSQQQAKINQSGTLALGTWAVGNILVSANRFDKKTENQYFYRMNMYWNIVNLGIATSGYLSSVSHSFEHLTDAEKRKKQQQIERLLLINSGLDVAYIAGGAYLRDKGVSQESRKLKGYGKSLMMQGGFLLLLDGMMYLKHRSNRKKYGKYQVIPAASANGVGLILRLR